MRTRTRRFVLMAITITGCVSTLVGQDLLPPTVAQKKLNDLDRKIRAAGVQIDRARAALSQGDRVTSQVAIELARRDLKAAQTTFQDLTALLAAEQGLHNYIQRSGVQEPKIVRILAKPYSILKVRLISVRRDAFAREFENVSPELKRKSGLIVPLVSLIVRLAGGEGRLITGRILEVAKTGVESGPFSLKGLLMPKPKRDDLELGTKMEFTYGPPNRLRWKKGQDYWIVISAGFSLKAPMMIIGKRHKSDIVFATHAGVAKGS